jgi:uncharacterized protein DUF998
VAFVPLDFRERFRSSAGTEERRLTAGRLATYAGLAVYNWWAVLPFLVSIPRFPDPFFSDMEARGQPHAASLQHLDLAAGLLLLAALVVGRSRGFPEWRLLLLFAGMTALGGLFPFACAEGSDAACRSAEWHFQLPLTHYVHMVSGIVEFAAASFAILFAWRRTRHDPDSPHAPAFRLLYIALLAAYPLLAYAYLADRYGIYIEPLFFIAFSAVFYIGTTSSRAQPSNRLAITTRCT